jgi:eukaryotic-like serine/threonine-protein kinase
MAVTHSLLDVQEPARRAAQLADRVLSSRYRVKHLIHSSAMSHVYEGEDLIAGGRVAIKVLRDDDPTDVRPMCRFFLEARVGIQLASCPSCVRVRDFGFTEQATPYFVMEYLEGEDLSSYLRRCKRLTPERAVEIILELCGAVAALHAAGIVHRDIKPSNVFMLKSGQIRLIDFGVCKSSADDLSLTTTGTLVGSLPYVPPERWVDPDDARICGDIWALAVVLCELLSGKLPFRGDGREALQRAISNQELDLHFEGEESCPELSTVLLVALHKDPGYRYSSVAEFAAALGRAAFDAGLREEPTWNAAPAPALLAPADAGSPEPTSPKLRSSLASTRTVLGAALLLTLGALALFVATSFTDSDPPSRNRETTRSVAMSSSRPPEPQVERLTLPAPDAPTRSAPAPTTRAVPARNEGKQFTKTAVVTASASAAATTPTGIVAPPLRRPPDPDFSAANGSKPAASGEARRGPAPATLDVSPSDLAQF